MANFRLTPGVEIPHYLIDDYVLPVYFITHTFFFNNTYRNSHFVLTQANVQQLFTVHWRSWVWVHHLLNFFC